MKYCFTLLLVLVCLLRLNGQAPVKLRSACSIVESSKSIGTSNGKYRIHQCVGQQGIVGTVSSNNKTLIQGYIQPRVSKSKKSIVNELDAQIIAVPFSDSYKIILNDNELTDLNISLYNIIGQKIYAEKVSHNNELEIDLSSYAIGCYILAIQAGQKQLSTKLLKK